MSAPGELPSSLRALLDDVARRQRRVAVARGAGAAVALSIAWVLAWCVADRLLHLPAWTRAIALGLNVLGITAVSVVAVRRWVAGGTDYVAVSRAIEDADPALGERLVTVTSRLIGPASYRGSDALLGQVTSDAATRAAELRPAAVVRRRAAAEAWGVAAVELVAAAGLWAVPWLDLPTLLRRYATPTADVAAVTTVRLHVAPGDVDVPQGERLTIDVAADRLGDRPATLLTRDAEGKAWTRHLMESSGPGRRSFKVARVEHDLQYKVEAGDAAAGAFAVRVLRRPVAAEFRVRYVYPAYTNRPPLTVSNTDGSIEAPSGTEATVSVTAIEPLSAASLTLGGGRAIDLAPAADERVRQGTLTIDRDATYTLSMTSDRGIAGEGPPGTAIRAIPDWPPVVRVLEPGDHLRLSPRDILPVRYQALDDYGVASLSVRAAVNAGPAQDLPVRLRGDARRQEDVVDVDLAPLNTNIGDVVHLSLAATDGKGQQTTTSGVRVLASPRSIDVNTHQRLRELANADALATSLAAAWAAAQRALKETPLGDRPDPRAAASAAEVNRQIVSALESAALLRQALLRAVARSGSAEQSVTLQNFLDTTERQIGVAQNLIGTRGASAAARQRLAAAVDVARRLREDVDVVADGDRAAAVLADRENLAAVQRATTQPAATDAARTIAARVRDDVAAEAAALGLDPNAADLDARLREKVNATTSLMRGQKSTDFAAASVDWSRLIAKPHPPSGFPSQLTTAAQSESVRPDADLTRARDLQVAARAAARIEASQVPTTRPDDPAPRDAFPLALSALQREHEATRDDARPATEELEEIRRRAADARRQVATWAGLDERPAEVPDVAVASAEDVESYAMAANAAAARKDYQAVSVLDTGLSKLTWRRPPGDAAAADDEGVPPVRAAQLMAAAERIDHLAARQQALAEETRAATTQQADELAARQAKVAADVAAAHAARVAEEMAVTSDPDWREEATAAIQQAQEELAAMPQAVAATAAAAGEQFAAIERARAAREKAAATTQPADAAAAAARSAEQAARDAADALVRVDAARAPVRPTAAEAMAERLRKFVPPTEPAAEAVEQQLLPAFRAIEQAITARDAATLDRAAHAARRAVGTVQEQLVRAQDRIVERNPLVAAKWFARAAADSLQKRPPDLAEAQRHQRAASAALVRAWDQQIHEAASERLAGVPSMASVFSFYAVDLTGRGAGDGLGAVGRLADAVPALREWGRLRPLQQQDVIVPTRETDPAGYEEPLRLYFEALSNPRGER